MGDAGQALNLPYSVNLRFSTDRSVYGAVAYTAFHFTVNGDEALFVLDTIHWNWPLRRLYFHHAPGADYGFVENRDWQRWDAYTHLRSSSETFANELQCFCEAEGMTEDAAQAIAYINTQLFGMIDVTDL